MTRVSNDRRSGPRKQSIHNDDMLRFDDSGSPKRAGSAAAGIAPFELPSPLAPGRKASRAASGMVAKEGMSDLKLDSSCSADDSEEEDWIEDDEGDII